MIRKLFVVFCVLALAAPVYGYDVIWDGDPQGDITIELQIDCYIQIDRQDPEIHFTNVSPFDWWSTTLVPVGTQKCPDNDGKHPMDPWAGDHWYAPTGLYYESDDGAVIFVRSNNDITMRVHTRGDLYGTVNSSANKIPTWFTLALCPFIINGVTIAGHTIPGGGCAGCYAHGPAGGGVMGVADAAGACSGTDYPSQHVFPCAPASQTWALDMDAPVAGTMKFLCRIHRNGMLDPGDHYYTWLDVDFTSP
ncbi:MAG: hypothetical protein WBF13_05060 [Candidatus Zixiibacteriota bacterium]